ncbi:hypothetical protein [Amycolatopsis sp. SID8362]|uniref:hypothetical protein n=1 Tax=Amycolatopsis sp. SID8362 TaxID=2690346 RepID=UPI0013714227|nr:hypothetical protein [Amycolatopsis sp. SID8362]NBH05982.1 hypothetical protein [Amycolatopsis sp. SID8362]NED42680.1 hypothetical protein [Amycolatopsis sp. SID8362]
MLVVVQLPLVDLRLLASFPTGRLASPHWPDPVSDDEFVRDAGPIRDRRRGGISDWSGERAFCDAKNFVRFVGAEPPSLRDGTRIIPVFRRLYSSGVSARLDFGFEVDERRRARLTGESLRDIARDCLSVKVRTAPTGAGRPLGDSGKALARRFLEVSTAKSFRAPGELVAGGHPAVLAEPSALPDRDLRSWRVDSTSVNGYQVEFGAKLVPVWSVVTGAAADRARARQIRGNLWRLHAERESLRGVIRAWNSTPEVFSEEKLKSFLAAQLKILVPKRRGGFDQSSALAFAGNCEELVSPAVLRGLRSELLGQSKGILKSLDLLIERTARLPESTTSNHIRITYVDKRFVDMSSNDKYEISAPVSNSVIGRDNKVEGNTWTVGGKDDALRELADAIELMKPRLDAEEAAEVDEAHAVIVDGKSEPGLLKRAAKKILGVATFAGEVGAPVVEAVRKVLAAFGLA